MTAAFYNNLRDNVAGPLILQFGQSGTLRQKTSDTYDPTTGRVAAGTDNDTTIQMLDLPLKDGTFEDELEEQMNGMLLIASKELAAAGVIPEPGDIVLFTKDGAARKARLVAKTDVGPSGISVIQKWGVNIA